MENDIYGLAWRLLSSKIASRRRKLIPKDELMRWQLWALEEAIKDANRVALQPGESYGQQKEA